MKTPSSISRLRSRTLSCFSFSSVFSSVDVALDGVGRARRIERQQVGVGHAHDGCSAYLRQRSFVHELGIAEVRVPVEVVVDGVIDAAVGLAAEADVERGHAGVVEERRVIGTITQRADTQIGPVAQILAIFGVSARARCAAAASASSTDMFFSGSCTSRATWFTMCSSVCEPETNEKSARIWNRN